MHGLQSYGMGAQWFRLSGSKNIGSIVVAYGLSCSVACGILPGQGSYPHPIHLHWQVDSLPLSSREAHFIPYMVE